MAAHTVTMRLCKTWVVLLAVKWAAGVRLVALTRPAQVGQRAMPGLTLALAALQRPVQRLAQVLLLTQHPVRRAPAATALTGLLVPTTPLVWW